MAKSWRRRGVRPTVEKSLNSWALVLLDLVGGVMHWVSIVESGHRCADSCRTSWHALASPDTDEVMAELWKKSTSRKWDCGQAVP
jgi:hypothetical protein